MSRENDAECVMRWSARQADVKSRKSRSIKQHEIYGLVTFEEFTRGGVDESDLASLTGNDLVAKVVSIRLYCYCRKSTLRHVAAIAKTTKSLIYRKLKWNYQRIETKPNSLWDDV